MGRALDNAMLNVGLKDVARGTEISPHFLDILLTYMYSWSKGSGLPNRRRHIARA